MAVIIEINNPFQPLKDTKRHEHKGGVTIRGWLEATYPGFKEFTHPTFCTVNGEAKLRAEWGTYKIAEDDVLNFIVVPGDPVTALYVLYAVLVIAAVAIALSIPIPGEPSKTNPDAVYDLRGQRNQNRLSSPIEVPYGRCRLFPSYAARSYNVYEGNKQYQFNLFCVGQGSYELDVPQYEDTPVTDFQEITYEVYEPGEPSTMFPDNVVTSAEVAGIELFGTNEPDFAIVGGFSANEAGTQTDKLQVDVSFPLGLYFGNTDGTLGNFTARALFEYREIDDTGTPIGLGTWLTLSDFSITRKTSTPQRFTLELSVTAGRYEVRAQRIGDHDGRPNIGNTIRWDALRAFLPSTQDFGNVTRIAVKALASNNLNDNSSQRFNVWGTRKLRAWDVGTQAWLPIAATRNPVWAFCDVFQATYGGKLADKFLALDDLAAFAATFETETRYFDYVFDQPATCWDAAQVIARVARCTRILNGPQITLVRDLPRTVPTAVFTPSNITEGSFNWEIKMIKEGEYDGVLIEYIDPVTWKPETIECLVGDDVGDNLEQIKLLGCTNRDYAYQEGIYIRKQRRLLRENIVFQTGFEGHIPTYGDLIRIAHDLPRWATSGLVVSIDGTTVVLNEPVTFVGTCVIGFRNKDGTESGPHACTAGANANTITLGAPLSDSFFFDDVHELPMFLFGPLISFGKLCTVTNLAPSEGEAVEVRAVVYADVYSAGDTPDPISGGVPNTPTVPVLNCATLVAAWSPTETGKVILNWAPALGAYGYKVETSNDGTDWDVIADHLTLNYYTVSVVPGDDFAFRITPYGLGSIVGASCTSDLLEAFTPPDDLLPPIEHYTDVLPVDPNGNLAIFHRERGGAATLIGFSPYSGPVNTKYLNESGSGVYAFVNGNGNGGDGGAHSPGATRYQVTNDSSRTFDPITAVGPTEATGHGIHGEWLNWGCFLYGSSPPASLAPGSGPMTVYGTAVIAAGSTFFELGPTSFFGWGGCDHGLSTSWGYSEGGLRWALSNEDTTANASTRLFNSLADLSTYPWIACTTWPCGLSRWTRKGSGITFERYEGEFQIDGDGYKPSTDYILTVSFERTNTDTAATDYFTQEYDVTTDGSGSFLMEADIPSEEGFQIRLGGPTPTMQNATPEGTPDPET